MLATKPAIKAGLNDNLLTVATSSLRPQQRIDDLRYPRVDYLMLQALVGGDLVDYSSYGDGWSTRLLRRIETQLRSDLFLALRVNHKVQKRTLFAMSERVGLPLAAAWRLRRNRPKLSVLFHCWSDRQHIVMKHLRLWRMMDQIIVQCLSMRDNLITLGVNPATTHLAHFGIDHQFYRPLPDVASAPNSIFTLGEIRSRDYATLFEAVRGVSADLDVAASGYHFAREKNTQLNSTIPDNVRRIDHLAPGELRLKYARSQVVALPIYPSVFSAGATASMEAMAMGRPVVATDSPGIRDYIIDGETGILVPAGDVAAWRAAICELLDNPKEAQRLGRNARERIEDELNIDRYVERLASILSEVV